MHRGGRFLAYFLSCPHDTFPDLFSTHRIMTKDQRDTCATLSKRPYAVRIDISAYMSNEVIGGCRLDFASAIFWMLKSPRHLSTPSDGGRSLTPSTRSLTYSSSMERLRCILDDISPVLTSSPKESNHRASAILSSSLRIPGKVLFPST